MRSFNTDILIESRPCNIFVIVVGLFLPQDESRSICLMRSLLNLCLSRISFVISDIIGKATIEQNRLLRDNTKTAPQIMYVKIFNIDIIDTNPTLDWEVESLKQLYNC